jgi:hypothetical protein
MFMVSQRSVDIAPEKESQCSFLLFLPTFQIFRAECKFNSARYITTYFVVTMMCKPEHGRLVVPFGPSANNCRSEHIYSTLLWNVAVTTEQLQEK